jgi:phosphoenolpyruvate carboxylase
MSEVRKIELPEKDKPLRADVSLLGSLVGEVLSDLHGPELLELVETVRKAAIRQREGSGDHEGEERLERMLAGLSHSEMMRVISAFSSYLRVVNIAERVHRIRRRRAYQREGAGAQRGSLVAVLGELRDAGFDAARVAEAIGALRIQPVFTAHPTEATRRTIQEKEYDILLRLVERLNPELTPDETRLSMERIRTALTSSWQTRIMPHLRPTVGDELDNILFYLTEILYRVTPRFYEELAEAFEEQYGGSEPLFPRASPNGIILRFGSWVGGDMDGNPNVTAGTVLETLVQQRNAIIRRYLPEVRRLARNLSQSLTEVGVSDEVLRRLERYRGLLPEASREIPERHQDMPYRCLLNLVFRRLQATLADEDVAYPSAEDFAADVVAVRDSLRAHRGEHAGLFNVERLLTRIRTFGFHLVTLDVRQDALLHRRVMGELLGCPDWLEREPAKRAELLAHLLERGELPDPGTGEGLSEEAVGTLEVFRAVSYARQTYGPAAIGLFIVSMTQGADDVLTVLALAEVANPHTGASSQLDVAPLLETVDDLHAGPAILEELLALKVYRKHLRSLSRRQVIMVGYSDSNKDSGIVASRWALYEAQRKLVQAGRKHEVGIVFFHGRGGTVSRGGGNLVNGILGAPPGSIGGFLRVTEQGEVINQKYGVRFLALRNLELVTGASLSHTLGHNVEDLDAEERAVLAHMAEGSRRRFRGLVYDDPEFAPWFRRVTPIDVIERLNIGSRPASRRSGAGIENLRAIPWVFSWAQVRIGFPGVFGFGTALDSAIEEFGLEKVHNLLEKSIFFQAMVNDVEMVLGKSELGIGRRYAHLGGADKAHFFECIEEEFALASRRILELKSLERLLDDQRVLQRNIRLRNPYVDPLHLLQIDLLHRWREGDRQDDDLLEALKGTVKGIALGIQNTG